MIRGPGGLQQVEHLRMLSVYRLQSTKILRELEADVGIPKTTVSKTLMQDLGMKHVVAKLFYGLCCQSGRNIVLQLLMT